MSSKTMEKCSCDPTIRIKTKYTPYIKHLFNVDSLLSSVELHQLEDVPSEEENYVHFRVKLIEGISPHITSELQKYVNEICGELEVFDKLKAHGSGGNINYSSVAGEDSSYDSDYEGGEEQTRGHDDVSRTVSDTLGQEFSEYVCTAPLQTNSAYQSKVEFALKLGYTEKLVQSALQKLGPNPEQNELLAELIKLGAHQQHSCSKLKCEADSCDNVEEFSEQNCVPSGNERNKLRPIVVDGSNVAMSHGNKEVFSCRGIKICVDWFRARGHIEITVFVPKWRKETPRPDNPVIDQDILYELERERLLVFTPSREVGGKRMVCYDDRYILKLAAENDGIVVSNDNYRDLIQECPEYRKVVEERILMFSFVNDRFMPPDDPLGRSGPTLDNFLKLPLFRKGEMCPYGKKCTYGNKCKYSHPERGLGPQKSVTERLVENAQKQMLARNFDFCSSKRLKGKSLSLPLQSSSAEEGFSFVGQTSYRKQPLSRTKSTTLNCKSDLVDLAKNTAIADNSRSTPIGYHPLGAPVAACTTATTPAVHISHSRQPASSAYYRIMYPVNPIPLNQSEVQPFLSSGSSSSDHDPSSSANLHRKLQRQLSINPTCDPRIYQMQRQLSSPSDTHHHLPASRHFSYQDANYLSPHSNVTRISSAPPAASTSYAVSSEYAHGSSSEPQLNLSSPSGLTNYTPASTSSIWSMQSSASASHNYIMMSQNIEETRRKLHYHLASIFPEEQVDAAMRYYPNETNPQKICSAILSMFCSKS